MLARMDTKEHFHALIGRAERPTQSELSALFVNAESIDIDFLLGEWAGHTFGDDGPEERMLKAIRWAGKSFRAADDVDPIVCFDDAGRRVANPVAGTAHLEMVEYCGAATATMVYETQPIRDHFRRIDDETVLGAMEKEGAKGAGYFYLTRL